MKLKVLQPMAQEDGKYMEWYRPESEDSNVLWSFVLHLRQEMYETNKSTKVSKYWAIYALRRKHPGKRKQNKHGLSWQSKHDAAESSKVETMTKFTNSHESQLPRDHKFHAFILFRCLKWLADLTDQKDHTSATPGLDVSKVSKRFWTKVIHISRVQETSWNAGFVSRFQASKAWVFPVCTWPVSHPFTSCHRVFECFKGSLLTWKRTRPLTCAALKLDTCLMSCVKSFEALRRITIPKSIALCAILHQIAASEEICLECHANTSLHVFATHIFFTRPRLLSKWNWAKGLLIVHNAQFVWSFVAKGLKMLYWKTYLKLLLVQYLQSSVCFLLASASGCPSYHLPLCVFPQCYTFYMSRHVAYAFQVSYHITSKETPIFAGPTAAAKPPSDFDGSSRLTRQGSSHRLRLQCNKQVHIYERVMRCEEKDNVYNVQKGEQCLWLSDVCVSKEVQVQPETWAKQPISTF